VKGHLVDGRLAVILPATDLFAGSFTGWKWR